MPARPALSDGRHAGRSRQAGENLRQGRDAGEVPRHVLRRHAFVPSGDAGGGVRLARSVALIIADFGLRIANWLRRPTGDRRPETGDRKPETQSIPFSVRGFFFGVWRFGV